MCDSNFTAKKRGLHGVGKLAFFFLVCFWRYIALGVRTMMFFSKILIHVMMICWGLMPLTIFHLNYRISPCQSPTHWYFRKLPFSWKYLFCKNSIKVTILSGLRQVLAADTVHSSSALSVISRMTATADHDL